MFKKVLILLSPPLVSCIIQKIVYKIEFKKLKNIYATSLLFSLLSFGFFKFLICFRSLDIIINKKNYICAEYCSFSFIMCVGFGFLEEVFYTKNKITFYISFKHLILCYLTIFLPLFTIFIQKHYPNQKTVSKIILFHSIRKPEVLEKEEADFHKLCVTYTSFLFPIYYFMLLLLPKKLTYKNSENEIITNWKKIADFAFILSLLLFLIQTPFGLIIRELHPFIKNNYVDPLKTKIIWPEKKRNLLMIYLESMESSYATKSNGGYFRESLNFIPELTKIALDPENVHFSHNDKLGGGFNTSAASWSCGGMIAMSAGLSQNVVRFDGMSYLPNAYTLYEMLENKNYKPIFIKGNVDCYGPADVIRTHNRNATIVYGPDIRKSKPEYKNVSKAPFGGVPDYVLYEYTLDYLKNKVDTKKPFAMYVETTTTHRPGSYCERCNRFFRNKYFNAIQCLDNQTKIFIDELKKLPFYNDTTVVLIGDHLSMSTIISKAIKNSVRTVYNVILNSAVKPKNISYTKNRKFLSHDWFPTIAASLGLKIEGERLGLGTNLFSGKKTLSEIYGTKFVNKRVGEDNVYYMAKFTRKTNDAIRIFDNGEWF